MPAETRRVDEALRLAFAGLRDQINDPVVLQKLAMLVTSAVRNGIADPQRIAGLALKQLGLAPQPAAP